MRCTFLMGTKTIKKLAANRANAQNALPSLTLWLNNIFFNFPCHFKSLDQKMKSNHSKTVNAEYAHAYFLDNCYLSNN